MTPYILYIKLALAGVLIALVGGTCWHLGSLGPKAALAEFQAKQSQLTADAVLAERASATAQAVIDHQAELTHAQTIVQIDAAHALTAPVFVCSPASEVPGRAVPGAAAQAGGVAADPKEGGIDPGRRVNIRAALDALEIKYEKILADYRQLDAEWPK